MIKLHCKPVLHTPAALHMRISIQMFLNNHFPFQTGNYAAAALPPRQVNMHHPLHICTSALPSATGIRWGPEYLPLHCCHFTSLIPGSLTCRHSHCHADALAHTCNAHMRANVIIITLLKHNLYLLKAETCWKVWKKNQTPQNNCICVSMCLEGLCQRWIMENSLSDTRCCIQLQHRENIVVVHLKHSDPHRS